MTKKIIPAVGANKLFDEVMLANKLKNDAALCRFLGVLPPNLCRMRKGKMPVGPSAILAIHERANISVRLIREFLAIGEAA